MIKTPNLIFLGPPGSGKGTISNHLVKTFNYQHISTGNIFREEIAKASDLGNQVKQLVNSGQYVPDDLTNLIVKNKILDLQAAGQHFILDGYPRTLDQAQFLDQLNLKNPFVVIELKIDDQKIIDRLSTRWFCSKCNATYNETSLRSTKHPNCQNDDQPLVQRADDQPEAIKKRLEVYHQQTSVLIDYYQSKKNLISINSDANLDIILTTIEDLLKHD